MIRPSLSIYRTIRNLVTRQDGNIYITPPPFGLQNTPASYLQKSHFSSVSSQNTTNSFRPTIFALSTKLSRSAIGVVRVSGSQSSYILQKLSRSQVPTPRVASVRRLYDPRSSILLDEALVIYFKSPKSYTGEDLLELHLHGGTAIIQSVLKAIKELHDPSSDIQIRYAENGEFSRRAFINGRFDLTEIEGIREMIDAETETQRIAALSSLTGNTKNLFQTWRDEIINNVALLTTVIDFGEEHDVEEVAELFDKVDGNINKLQQQIEQYLIKVRRSEILVKGVKLILLGPPNAGKSSLLNYLANKDAAIVSDIAGTTRDVIDVPLDISGYKVVVGDTAGIRGTDMADSIEREGIRRAKDKSLTGDLVIAVLPVNSTQGYDELFGHISFLQKEGKEIIVVLNKQDLLTEQVTHSSTASKSYTAVEVATKYSQQLDIPVENFHVVSCITGYGMADLTNTLVENFKSISLSDSTDPIIVSSRVQDLIENDVLHGLEQFRLWKAQDDVVLATESLKQSVEGIGKISGHAIGVEEILGVVFSKFCIGK